MATPEPSPDLQRWSRRYSITPTSLQAIVDRAHHGPTVPPFNGLPVTARRELGTLSLEALTELRELTEEYLHHAHPSPVPPPAEPGAPAQTSTFTPALPPVSVRVASGRQPRSAWPAMDALPEAVWIEDVSSPGRPLVYINQAFTDLTGYTRDHVLGTAMSATQTGLFDPSADPALRALGSSTARTREANRQIQNLIATRRSGSAQIVIRHEEGYLLHAQVTLAPVTEDDGEVVHYVAVLRSLR